eukprot:gene14914-17635_t
MVRANFKHNNGQYKCFGNSENPTCTKMVELGSNVFGNPTFTSAVIQFSQTLELMRNINCQICRCGCFSINETLYANQKCPLCSRDYCFFCNRDWQSGSMKNNKYYCSVGCNYKTIISYELVPLAYDDSIKLPNRRCCPSCLTPGAYDSKCKYHTCSNPKCNKKTFCFICLLDQAECQAKYKSNYAHKCTEIVEQKYTDFPHL